MRFQTRGQVVNVQPEARSEVPSDSVDAQQNPLSLVVEFESKITGWWQLKYLFIFTPKLGEDEPILTSIFFKGVGLTTNLIIMNHY